MGGSKIIRRPFAGFLVLACAVILLALPARADSVLLGTGGSVTGGPGLFPDNYLAQGFSLTTTANVSSINVFISGVGVGSILMQLTDSIGPGTTASNLLSSATFAQPNSGGGLNGQWVSIPVSVTLGAGTYYIVLSTTNSGGGWLQFDTYLPSSVGSVGSYYWSNTATPLDSTFPPASTWNTCGPGISCALGFEVVGNTSVPEPGTLVLLSLGLAAVWCRRRR